MTRQWQRQLFILLGLWLTWGTPDVWAGVTPRHLSRDSLQAQSSPEIRELPLVIEGRLDENSEMGPDGHLLDIYLFQGSAGDVLVIELVAHDINAGWIVMDWEGNLIGTHPQERNTEETVRVELPRTGGYAVGVYGYQPGETGNYQLTVRPATAAESEETRLLQEAHHLNQQVLQLLGDGRYQEAIPLAQRALEIRETALGGFHPDVATSLNNLAELYRYQGNYNAAEPLYHRSLEILETALGESHPHVAISLNNLALLYQAQGDISQSLSFRKRGLEIEETNLAQNLAIGSEARKQAYIATLTGTTYATFSLHLQDAPDHPEAARLALTTVLRRKGRILDAVTQTQQLLRDNLSPELAPLLDDYTNAQTQLATRLYAGLGDQDPDLYRSEIDTLRQQVEQLENDLSRRSAEFRVATEPVEIEAVQALLPNDAALVELVQYSPFDFTSLNRGTPRYAAYILHASGDPQWVDLGDAETIDNAAFAFLHATQVPNSQQRVQITGRHLDELLMAPIRPLLGDATHLLLSPDGQLNLIPFAALVDEENRYLVESYQLTHLTTGRDLLRLQNPRPSRQPPVLFANPNYDDADTSAVTQVAQATRGESQRSMEIEDLQFGELSGTQREVEAIAPLLDNPIVLTEAEATENALKQVQAPSILHLATHGFFLQDVEFVPPQPLTDFTRGEIELVTGGGSGGFATPPSDRPTSSENPLLRSGLALAGFNSRDSEGEDGVLTALEVVGLDLRGTRLVVMSACETGVGDVANGEGVYGLRRAFVMAGAESQLMSLWKVADEETADLMGDYYQRLLVGEGRSEALREVQLDWLSRGRHPYYWASFLFSGQWTPMD